MKLLKVQRFMQMNAHCAVAASATVANYYNSSVTYENTIPLAKRVQRTVDKDGMNSAEIGLLLNKLGFKKVRIISSDINYLDYSWTDISKTKLIEIMRLEGNRRDDEYRYLCKSMVRFLTAAKRKNEIVIDYRFGNAIREAIDNRKPVMVDYNWTMFFRKVKEDQKEMPDPRKGDYTRHAVVIYGYNKAGAYVADSHQRLYKYRLKEFRKGRYHVPWETLMTIMGFGDVFIAEDYDKELCELVS
jgi:ABC-type bacteriocin/lantibiotic exporter with double-glycine peptidase domain